MKFVNKLTQLIKILLVAIIVSLFSLSAVEASAKMPAESTVAEVNIDGLTYDEIREKMQKEVNTWLERQPLLLMGFNETISIPREAFQFDIEHTLQQAQEKTDLPWYLFFKKRESINLPLTVTVDLDKIDIHHWPHYINVEATLKKAADEAANLNDMLIETVYKEDDAVEKEIAADISFTIPDELFVDVYELAEQLDGEAILPDDSFSMIESVLTGIQPSLSDDSVNFFASALYALMLQTDLDIIERHSQLTIPAYTEAGVEAAVNERADKDFVIYNPGRYTSMITAEITDDQLQLVMNSVLKDKQINYYTEITNEIEPRTLYRYRYDLPAGTETAMESGQKGVQVETYRVESIDGESEETLISRDFYPPEPTVFVRSTKEEPEEPEQLEVDDRDPLNRLVDQIVAGEQIEQTTDSADTETTIYEDVLGIILINGLLNIADYMFSGENIGGDGFHEQLLTEDGEVDEMQELQEMIDEDEDQIDGK